MSVRENALAALFARLGAALTGRSPALDQLMKLDPSSDPVPVDPAGAGERSGQLPMSRDVVSFTAE